jgi:hypothetical protein
MAWPAEERSRFRSKLRDLKVSTGCGDTGVPDGELDSLSLQVFPHQAPLANEEAQPQSGTLVSLGAAYSLQWEDEVGSIVPGKVAKLAVLSDNPVTGPP